MVIEFKEKRYIYADEKINEKEKKLDEIQQEAIRLMCKELKEFYGYISQRDLESLCKGLQEMVKLVIFK